MLLSNRQFSAAIAAAYVFLPFTPVASDIVHMPTSPSTKRALCPSPVYLQIRSAGPIIEPPSKSATIDSNCVSESKDSDVSVGSKVPNASIPSLSSVFEFIFHSWTLVGVTRLFKLTQRKCRSQSVYDEEASTQPAARIPEPISTLKKIAKMRAKKGQQHNRTKKKKQRKQYPAFSAQRKTHLAASDHPPTNPEFELRECTNCEAKLPIADFPVLKNCTHTPETCATCYQDWLSAQLEQLDWDKIRCPGCRNIVHHEEVKAYATIETFDR